MRKELDVPTDDDLRESLGSTETRPHSIDLDRVIARSRARRLPRQLATGALGALAFVGIGVWGVQLTQLAAPVATMSSLADGGAQPEAADGSTTDATTCGSTRSTLLLSSTLPVGLTLLLNVSATATTDSCGATTPGSCGCSEPC